MSASVQISISGDLTMNKVADAMKRVADIPKQSEIVINLAQTGEADSSAVAFLLNCLRIGRERGATVRFAAVPASITTLADIYGLGDVIASHSA